MPAISRSPRRLTLWKKSRIEKPKQDCNIDNSGKSYVILSESRSFKKNCSRYGLKNRFVPSVFCSSNWTVKLKFIISAIRAGVKTYWPVKLKFNRKPGRSISLYREQNEIKSVSRALSAAGDTMLFRPVWRMDQRERIIFRLVAASLNGSAELSCSQMHHCALISFAAAMQSATLMIPVPSGMVVLMSSATRMSLKWI